MRTALTIIGGIVVAGLVLAAIGYAYPVVILAALVVLVLAWRKPNLVASWTEHAALAWLPASLRATPRRFAVISAATLIPVALIAGAVVYSDPADPSPDDVVAAAPTPTPTPTLTPTPIPPPEPTPTSAPTRPPEPTATPRRSMPRDEYLQTIGDLSESMGTSMRIFGELMDNAQPGDALWRNRVGAEMDIWRVNYYHARTLVPPSEFAELHDLFTQALERFESASDDIEQGLDTGNASLLNRAAEKIEEGSALLQQASALVERR